MHDLTQHRYFRRNQRGRDFVVSDLHGRLDRLDYRLEQQGFDPERDRLFAVGDLVDRGDNSAALVERLEERWFFSVLGNHELMLLDALADPHREFMDNHPRLDTASPLGHQGSGKPEGTESE